MSLLTTLPINIVNRILEDASILNEDTWIPQLKEVTKKQKEKTTTYLSCILTPNNVKFAKLTKITHNNMESCILKISPNGMYIKSYHMVQTMETLKSGKNVQHHNVKTVGFVNGEKVNIFVSLKLLHNPSNNTYEYVKNSGNMFYLESNTYRQIESVTFIDKLLIIALYEFNGNWSWNSDLQIIEFVVDAYFY